MNPTVVFARTFDHDYPMPSRAHLGDAGFDLMAVENGVLDPGETRLFDTGWSMQMPEYMVGFVCSRSGLAAKKGVHVLNSPGIIDSGYRGSMGVTLHNASQQPVVITKGDRMAQLLFLTFQSPHLEEVAELDEHERGQGGFGSTGS